MSAVNDNYKRNNIMTASPMELVLILYDEAIKSLFKAEEDFKIEGPSRIQEINNDILHVQNVLTELTSGLNFEKGGEISTNLYNLYEYMSYQLSQANMKKQMNPIKEVRGLMCELREAWQKVAQQEAQSETDHHQPAQGGIMIAG